MIYKDGHVHFKLFKDAGLPVLFILADGVELLLLPGVALDPGDALFGGDTDLWDSLLPTLASSGCM